MLNKIESNFKKSFIWVLVTIGTSRVVIVVLGVILLSIYQYGKTLF